MTNYKCIVTLRSGAHKIVRMTKDVMARLVMAFRKNQTDPWLTRRYEETFENLGLTPGQVIRLLFINEFTGEKLEIA